MNKIKFDKKNYRKHSDKNKRIIEKSLKELGTGRSILIDSENEIIAGNGVYEQAEKNKIPVKIIETDGKELIAIKRIDLKTSDKKRKELALIDNHASDTSEFDMELVLKEFTEKELSEWEVSSTITAKGYFESQIDNINENNFENNENVEKLPYPITIVVSEKQYYEWLKIKEELKEESDYQAFIKIYKKISQKSNKLKKND